MKIETIGQKNAVALLENYGQRIIDTGIAGKPRLVHGPAGVGKSHLVGAFISALCAQLEGCNLLRVKSASEFARSDAPASLALISALKDSMQGIYTIVDIDEVHSLPIAPMSASPSPMQRVFNSLLYGSGEGWARFGHVEFLGEQVNFDSRYLIFLLATNHPEKIGGKNSDAIRRRVTEIPLELYTSAEMRKVLPAFFAKKGREVDKEALKELLKLHRGTLEAADHILELVPANVEITLPHVLEVLEVSKFKLRGFLAEELRAMHWLASTTEPRKRQNIALRFQKLDLSAMYRHAIGQVTPKKGPAGMELMQTPFMFIDKNQGYAVSETFINWYNKNKAALAHVFATE